MNNRLGKNFKCLGAWNRIELSLEEEYELQQELRKSNIDIMKECLHDAKELLGENCQSQEAKLVLATALFNKRAQQSYSVYQTYLDNLIQEMKRKEEKLRKQSA